MDKEELIEAFIITPILILVVVVAVLTPLLAIDYYSSCQEAIIFNELNQTEYTCKDFFWAREQINSSTQTIKLK